MTPPPPATDEPGQRSHILRTARDLMSRHGSSGTSMRRLAAACDLNVATLYHYFPSKADLLEALIADRQYMDRLAADEPPVDPSRTPRDRLTALLSWLWEQTEQEHDVLRLIVGEATHGDATARQSADELIQALDSWLTALLAEGFPELAERGIPTGDAAMVVRRHLLGLVAEALAVAPPDGKTAANELAAALFPDL